MSSYTALFASIANVVDVYTRKMTGKNLITQCFGNNTCSEFTMSIGKVNLKFTAGNQPARFNVVKSLKGEKFVTSKNKLPEEYQRRLLTDGLPSEELIYLTGYTILSMIRGSNDSVISGVRSKYLKLISDTIKSDMKLTFPVSNYRDGENITCIWNDKQIRLAIESWLWRGDTLDKLPDKGKAGKSQMIVDLTPVRTPAKRTIKPVKAVKVESVKVG